MVHVAYIPFCKMDTASERMSHHFFLISQITIVMNSRFHGRLPYQALYYSWLKLPVFLTFLFTMMFERIMPHKIITNLHICLEF